MATQTQTQKTTKGNGNVLGGTAAANYARRADEIADLIIELQGHLSTHRQRQSARPTDWGFTGDLGHVAEKMQDIVTFLGGEGR